MKHTYSQSSVIHPVVAALFGAVVTALIFWWMQIWPAVSPSLTPDMMMREKAPAVEDSTDLTVSESELDSTDLNQIDRGSAEVSY